MYKSTKVQKKKGTFKVKITQIHDYRSKEVKKYKSEKSLTEKK